jgi:hypothetical protein
LTSSFNKRYHGIGERGKRGWGGEEERRGGRRGSVLSTNVQWLMRNRSPNIYLQYRERELSASLWEREKDRV